MRTKEGFNIREVCGEYIVIAEGKQNIDFTSIISMNESAAYLWRKVQDTEFTAEDMARHIMDEYAVDYATALQDCTILLQKWKDAGIVE